MIVVVLLNTKQLLLFGFYETGFYRNLPIETHFSIHFFPILLTTVKVLFLSMDEKFYHTTSCAFLMVNTTCGLFILTYLYLLIHYVVCLDISFTARLTKYYEPRMRIYVIFANVANATLNTINNSMSRSKPLYKIFKKYIKRINLCITNIFKLFLLQEIN